MVKVKKDQPSLKDFDLLKVLGCGAFGKVMLVVHKETKKPYAMKALKKKNILEDDEMEITITERNVLAMGEHCRFITSLYCSFQNTDRLFFVMEYLNGGDLFFHIMQDKKFSEERARFYCAQISLAFLFLHNRRIVYRDLKLDNVMLTKEVDKSCNIKQLTLMKYNPRATLSWQTLVCVKRRSVQGTRRELSVGPRTTLLQRSSGRNHTASLWTGGLWEFSPTR